MKIAQALLLRKQLESKVKQLEPIKQMGDQGLIKTMTKIDSITKRNHITTKETATEKYTTSTKKEYLSMN